jgi:GGDEF domain-containing protein/CHASE3 domain sensor protein
VRLSSSKLTEIIPPAFLERLVPKDLFSRLDIARKMLFGYMVLVLMTIIVVVYALVNLQRLNSLNTGIVTVDVQVLTFANDMQEAIEAQDGFEGRYLITHDPEYRKLFQQRGEAFVQKLEFIEGIPDHGPLPIAELRAAHEEYSGLFAREVKLVRSGMHDEALRVSTRQTKEASDRIMTLLRDMKTAAGKAQETKLQRGSMISRSAFLTTLVLSGFSIVLGIIGSLVVTHHISSSLNKLRVATRQIAEGNFDYDPQIHTNDEIGDLAAAFIDMGKRLKNLEEMYLDASPLTRLPGGIAIENVLKKRIDARHPLAFCVIDLDNFKSYNDRYGYAQGSELIKETARIIESGVRARGAADDFIGHVGGDDFVIITVPERMRSICEDIITRFDRRIPDFYDENDRKNGYIMGKTRQGAEMKFPMVTISIAIVTNEHRLIASPLEASEIGAELKDYAKTIPKSIYVIDKRRSA